MSGELIKRLRKKFAPGSLLHYGQGKWYPGEPLPRWALGCYWRKDGVPIWKDDSLIADESKDYGHGAKEAKELLTRIAEVVGARSEISAARLRRRVLLHVEGAPLPVERHAGKIQSEGQAGARPHRADFSAGPRRGRRLRAADQTRLVWQPAGWMSGAWFLRDDDTLWLIPGDSPMGLRLPLDSIPWVAEKDYPWIRQQDPSQPKLPELPKEFPYRARRPETTGQRFLRGGGAPTPAGYGPGQRAQQLGELGEANRIAAVAAGVRSEPPSRAGPERAVDHPHRAVRRAARRTVARLHAAGRDARKIISI